MGTEGGEVRLEPDGAGARTSNQAFYLEWLWFLEGLRTGVPSAMAAGSCLAVTALIEDLYREARGKP
jgi:hypothetical protein